MKEGCFHCSEKAENMIGMTLITVIVSIYFYFSYLCTYAEAQILLPSQDPDERFYHRMFPLHIKLCFSTHGQEKDNPQTGEKGQFIKGTHSFMYLKGVCQDKQSSVPQLKRCALDGDIGRMEDPNFGVGVGVIEGLKNVKFTIIPNLDILLYGYAQPGETLTKESYSAMAERLIKEHDIYKGVQWHSSSLPRDRTTGKKMLSTSPETHVIMAKKARGSDWAIALGRTVYCVNIPVTSEEMDQVVDYLNTVNRMFTDPAANESLSSLHSVEQGLKKMEEGFHFSYIKNSCAHLAANALHRLDLLKAFPTRSSFLAGLLRVPVPSAMVMDLFEYAVHTPFTFSYFLQKKLKQKKQEKDQSWKYSQNLSFPRIPGVILRRYGIYEQNDLFDPTMDQYLMSTIFYPQRSHQLKTEVFHFRTDQHMNKLFKFSQHQILEQHLLAMKKNLEQELGFLNQKGMNFFREDKKNQQIWKDWKREFNITKQSERQAFEKLLEDYKRVLEDKILEVQSILDKIKTI